MDPSLDLQAQRLFVATALTAQAMRCFRGHAAANIGAEELLAMAHRLTEQIGPIQRRYGLRFEPSYPGLTAGVESAGGTLRLVLACTAYTSEEKPLGVVFTPCSLVDNPRCRWRQSRRVFPENGKNCMICLEILSIERAT
jgi:hypothetical protein